MRMIGLMFLINQDTPDVRYQEFLFRVSADIRSF